jgi:hypothetical protein
VHNEANHEETTSTTSIIIGPEYNRSETKQPHRGVLPNDSESLQKWSDPYPIFNVINRHPKHSGST